jgi:hypothetical protein
MAWNGGAGKGRKGAAGVDVDYALTMSGSSGILLESNAATTTDSHRAGAIQ